VSSLGQEDVAVSLRGVVEAEPFGSGVEESTSSGSLTLLEEWEVPMGRQAQLDEIAVEAAANGEVDVRFGGRQYGPYSGATSATIPFDGATLVELTSVRVYHRSTDGNATTSKAQLTGRLF
jgi:hypothetical protein